MSKDNLYVLIPLRMLMTKKFWWTRDLTTKEARVISLLNPSLLIPFNDHLLFLNLDPYLLFNRHRLITMSASSSTFCRTQTSSSFILEQRNRRPTLMVMTTLGARYPATHFTFRAAINETSPTA